MEQLMAAHIPNEGLIVLSQSQRNKAAYFIA
jgi:hypothetical protein